MCHYTSTHRTPFLLGGASRRRWSLLVVSLTACSPEHRTSREGVTEADCGEAGAASSPSDSAQSGGGMADDRSVTAPCARECTVFCGTTAECQRALAGGGEE